MLELVKNISPKFIKKAFHSSRNAWRGWWYRGDARYCICCDGHFSRFLDMQTGSHPRKGVVCPKCGSAERHRLLLRYLQANEASFFKKGIRILYIAPMIGIRNYFKQLDGVHYLGADLGSSLAEEHFDLQDIPYPDASFDFCICSHTLAHVREDKKALNELNRVLSDGGTLLVLERLFDYPNTHDLAKDMNTEERLEHYGQVDRWRVYGQDFPDYLASFGFSVEVVKYGDLLSDELLAKEVIDAGEVVYCCVKRS